MIHFTFKQICSFVNKCMWDHSIYNLWLQVSVEDCRADWERISVSEIIPCVRRGCLFQLEYVVSYSASLLSSALISSWLWHERYFFFENFLLLLSMLDLILCCTFPPLWIQVMCIHTFVFTSMRIPSVRSNSLQKRCIDIFFVFFCVLSH